MHFMCREADAAESATATTTMKNSMILYHGSGYSTATVGVVSTVVAAVDVSGIATAASARCMTCCWPSATPQRILKQAAAAAATTTA
jgi:ABC-type phosphate transport system auxiliary subunit